MLLHLTAQRQQLNKSPSASQNLAQLLPPQGWQLHLAHPKPQAPCWHMAPMHGDPPYVQGLPKRGSRITATPLSRMC